LVAVRLSRVFGGDNVTDFFLHTLARDVVPVAAFETALEKEFEFKEPLRCVHVFVCRGSTHRGFMHVDVFSDIPKHHGF